MKRNPEGGGGGMTQGKRFRAGPDEPCLRILIPSKVAGSIIGKGGKNISRLRTEFNVSVNVPDCPGPERIVTVLAEDYDEAIKVVEEILPSLEDFFKSSKSGEADVRLLVHQSLAGCVIGKAGSKIKELREKTGARIKIFSNCCPQSTDRVISIMGNSKVCSDAIKEVVELLKDTPVKGYSELYNPYNFDEEFAEEYGGFGQGPPPRVWESQGPPPRGGMRGRGPPPPPPHLSPPPNGNPRHANTTQVTIPKDMAGAIIGKAGNRIRKIRMESGADITIDEPLMGSNDRIITIVGAPDQIQMAQFLLQQSVLESQRNKRF